VETFHAKNIEQKKLLFMEIASKDKTEEKLKKRERKIKLEQLDCLQPLRSHSLHTEI